MASREERTDQLREAIEQIAEKSAATAIAVALHDAETDFRFSHRGDRMFHAASTIKVAILLALYRAIDEGRIRAQDPLHVRNRFRSAIDGSPYRLDQDSDGCPELYRATGRTMKIAALAEEMTVRSSNLATNLLLDYVGLEYAAQTLDAAGVRDVALRRGVEDHRAHERGVNNETTADGLLTLFAALRRDFLSQESRDTVIHILLGQRFNSMIPAGLPSHATVAHKTGEISTVCHDAGIVYLPERAPYLLAILTEAKGNPDARRATVADVSRAVYEAVTGKTS